MHSVLARRAVIALLFAVGVLVGVAGAFTQAMIVWAGTVPLPFGVVLTLLGCAGLYVFGGTLLRSAAGAALPGVGWLLPTALFLVYQPHGSTVISLAADVHGIVALVYVLVGVVIILAVAYTPWRLVTERWDQQVIGRRADPAVAGARDVTRGATAGSSKAGAGHATAGSVSGAGVKPTGRPRPAGESSGGATKARGGSAEQRPHQGSQARKR